MKLNQLSDQLQTKTIHLITIAKALELTELPTPHGGTPLSPAQAEQVTAVFRYMQERQMTDPKVAIAQMKTAASAAAPAEEVTVSLRASVADELRCRYPEGTLSDCILRLLGALQSFEQIYPLCVQPTAISTPIQPTSQP